MEEEIKVVSKKENLLTIFVQDENLIFRAEVDTKVDKIVDVKYSFLNKKK